MPTLLRWKGYRFFFYSADGWEPPHVHVVKDGREAKIWLRDISVAVNLGFSARDLNEIIGPPVNTELPSWRPGMTTLVLEIEDSRPVEAHCDDTLLRVKLADGRSVSTPIWWYPRLRRPLPRRDRRSN